MLLSIKNLCPLEKSPSVHFIARWLLSAICGRLDCLTGRKGHLPAQRQPSESAEGLWKVFFSPVLSQNLKKAVSLMDAAWGWFQQKQQGFLGRKSGAHRKQISPSSHVVSSSHYLTVESFPSHSLTTFSFFLIPPVFKCRVHLCSYPAKRQSQQHWKTCGKLHSGQNIPGYCTEQGLARGWHQI